MRGLMAWLFWFFFLLPGVWADGTNSQWISSTQFDQSCLGLGRHNDFVPHWTSHQCGAHRFGEALHPGPGSSVAVESSTCSSVAQVLRVGCSNPGGFRNKELSSAELGPGIWCLSEIQLTAAGQRSSSTRLRHFGNQMNRQIRVHHGAPAPFRYHDGEAGAWTGVCIHSDFPSQPLSLDWPSGTFSTGRLLVTKHMVQELPLTVATIYGYPGGPTWPQSRAMTDQLLSIYTQQIVIGGSGPRIIVGDMNKMPHQLDELSLWQHLGWVEAQDWAFATFQQPIQMTCKQATRIDQIWLSPEAAALLRQVGIQEVFADHATLYVDLNVPLKISCIDAWPRPSKIDWSEVDLSKWHQQLDASLPAPYIAGSSTDFLASWTSHWEAALEGCCTSQPQGKMPPQWKGRAQRIKPVKMQLAPPTVKPSRSGEVTLRCDSVSMVTQKWFKQLRRIQSFRHAAVADKQTVDAIAYRLNLWQSIKQAGGFDPSFGVWWLRRAYKDPDAPTLLPLAPPDGPLAEIIFHDFRRNFDRFERWELNQRKKVLQSKYQLNCHQVFKDLRPPQRGQLDMLWDTMEYCILAVDPETCSIHLDRSVLQVASCTWSWNGVALDFTSCDNDLVCFHSLPPQIEPGDLLACQRTFSTVEQLHTALTELWQPRWNQISLVGSDDWTRIVNFIQAFMPRTQFTSPPLDEELWRRTLNSFPTNPARGVDGIDVADLKHLPSSTTAPLLDFLSKIDGVNVTWPKQLLFGLVISLAKCDGAHLASQYRPVVILGTIYRAWSKMKAIPLLEQLAHHVPPEALGFLPGRECAQVWFQLQAIIELGLQQRIDMSGFSADVEKCFNNVGRDSLWLLARHLGIPSDLLGAWRSFLDSFVRSFQVRTALSLGIASTQGLPEGCSLSVMGMVLVNWALHTYQRALLPTIHLYSYVDNISVTGHSVDNVIAAFFSTYSFFKLWGLSLDDCKTYFWSTSPADRAHLQLLGMTLKQDALELGGSLSFEASKRTRLLRARGAGLKDKWDRLRRSLAPVAQKFMMLYLVFWPAALYGAAACPVADDYVQQLRQAANKALRSNKAGSNAMLRFTLDSNMCADPGFYHILTVIQTFRRICGRTPRTLDFWKLWMTSFRGTVTHGPFGVLMTALNKLGWSVHMPPMIADHWGVCHDLLLTPWTSLRHLLEEGWALYVSAQVTHRKLMADLRGIDLYVTKFETNQLTAHQRSLLSALQSGAFIDAWTHGKYDVTKVTTCQMCQFPNDHEHVLSCARYDDLRTELGLDMNLLQTFPCSLKFHLLCPLSPFVVDLRSYFMDLPDVTEEFFSSPLTQAKQHLFTDGSAIAFGRVETHRAAWAVYNSTSGLPVASGALPGLPQTIGRAELTAFVAALRWALAWRTAVHVWVDAKFVHEGFQKRRQGYRTRFSEKNADLWLIIDELIGEGATFYADSSWIPSHLALDLCESPFEEWIAENNGRVDELAVSANQQRSVDFARLSDAQMAWDKAHCEVFCKLRAFYFSVFDQTHAEPSPIVLNVPDSEDETDSHLYSFSEVVSQDMDANSFVQSIGFPFEFCRSILRWVHNHESDDASLVAVSYVELTFGFLKIDRILFPFRDPVDGIWKLMDRYIMFERPTLVYFLRIVQKVFGYICHHWTSSSPIVHTLDRSILGIMTPQSGVVMRLRSDVLASIREAVSLFTRPRPVRRTADLARPVA